MAYILTPKKSLLMPQRRIALPSRQKGFLTPFGGPGWSGKVGAADFDGTDRMYYNGTPSGIADGTKGVFSVWIRIDGGDGTRRRLFNFGTSASSTVAGPRFSLVNGGGNQLQITFPAAGSYTIVSSSGFAAGASWIHWLYSWDTAAVAPQQYINDASDLSVTGWTGAGESIDWTHAYVAIGGNTDNTELWNGCVAELYLFLGNNLDISVASNRRKFISAAGKPVYLGENGASPMNAVPALYMRLAKNEAVANFANNRAPSEEAFTISGTLAAASTSPSD